MNHALKCTSRISIRRERKNFCSKLFSWKHKKVMGGITGLVIIAGDSCSEGRGFESQ